MLSSCYASSLLLLLLFALAVNASGEVHGPKPPHPKAQAYDYVGHFSPNQS